MRLAALAFVMVSFAVRAQDVEPPTLIDDPSLKPVVRPAGDAGVRGQPKVDPKLKPVKPPPVAPVVPAALPSNPAALKLVAVGDAELLKAVAAWRTAVTQGDVGAEGKARAALLSLRDDGGLTGVEGVAMGLLRAARAREKAGDAATAVDLGLAAVSLAPTLPAGRVGLAWLYLAVDPTEPGRVVKELGAALRATLADPRFLRPAVADVAVAGLAAVAVLASVLVFVLAARRLRYCLHDLHFFFPRLMARWQSATIGVLVLGIPFVFRMGLVPSLLLVLAALCLYLSLAERVVASVLVASLGLVPVGAGRLASWASWNGTRAEDVAIVARGDLGSDAAASRLEVRAANSPLGYAELYALGLRELRRGRADAAVARFQSALVTRPNDPLASVNLAVAMIAAGDLQNPKELLEQAQRALPGRPEPSFNLARYYQRRVATSAAENAALEVDQGNAAMSQARALGADRPEPSADAPSALSYLWAVPLPAAELGALAESPDAQDKVQAQVSSFLLGDVSGLWAWLYPLLAGAAIVGLGFLSRPLDASKACEKCGRPASHRGDPELQPGSTMCAQCVNVFARKGVVPPSLKVRKQAEVDRYATFVEQVSRVLGLVCSGMGHVFRGQVVRGVVWALVFLFFASLVVLRAGVMRVEWEGLSPGVRLGLYLPLGLLVWALSLRSLWVKEQA